MTADVTVVISQVEEAVGFGGLLEGLVYVFGIYVAQPVGLVKV